MVPGHYTEEEVAGTAAVDCGWATVHIAAASSEVRDMPHGGRIDV